MKSTYACVIFCFSVPKNKRSRVVQAGVCPTLVLQQVGNLNQSKQKHKNTGGLFRTDQGECGSKSNISLYGCTVGDVQYCYIIATPRMVEISLKYKYEHLFPRKLKFKKIYFHALQIFGHKIVNSKIFFNMYLSFFISCW